LANRHGNTPGVCIHPFGLAASEGTVPFYAYSREASELTSLRVPLHSHVPHRVQTASVHTGERVCRDLNIERIDFLKVDVEGADYDVLTGFSGLLNPNHIGIIQFEHEGGRYLHDFYALLAPKGYAIGKIYANYVDFRPHHAEMEHCPGPNYLAVPVAQQALIDTLKKGWAFRS
jgi:FkbM family methyltransferase